ncbi:MAG TPA: Ig-like domain-containing protein [Candidatus Sulfotelmatobacter sp.]|jgi:hypothetical protein|nr:Ig-like domain-containing protein [Candidatus Sulfotelmatobacter sp.]
MSYAHNRLLNKKLPSYVGIFVLLIALSITILLSGNAFIFVSKATVGSDPKGIQISNISDTTFTISYTTDAPAIGTISYGTDPSTPSIMLDDRDQQTSKTLEHQVHIITIKHLIPSTKYYYVIDSGTQKAENNGKPFEITTDAPLSSKQIVQPLIGTVALSDGSIPTEGIVYITSAGTQQLATLINSGGTYQLSLNQLRNSTMDAFTSLTPDTELQLQVITATQHSTATVLVRDAAQVPKIVLSQNYDFTLGITQLASGSGQIASQAAFPIFGTPVSVSSPEITTPKDTQTFKDQQPMFQGKALPNTEVDIIIQSNQEISVKLQSDTAGSWQFRPSITLAPGKHTITIKSINASGIMQTLSRSFTVYAAGSQFIEPSVSPIASTVSPSPTLAITPTATPTTIVVPTATVVPTGKPTPVPSKAPIPKTGSSAIVTGITAGISVLGVGALLFILSTI